jgi:hypothetical protein
MSTPISVVDLFSQFMPLVSLVLVMFIVIALIKQLRAGLA